MKSTETILLHNIANFVPYHLIGLGSTIQAWMAKWFFLESGQQVQAKGLTSSWACAAIFNVIERASHGKGVASSPTC